MSSSSSGSSTGISFLGVCAMFYTAWLIGGVEFFSRFEGKFWHDLWEMIKYTLFWWWELLTIWLG